MNRRTFSALLLVMIGAGFRIVEEIEQWWLFLTVLSLLLIGIERHELDGHGPRTVRGGDVVGYAESLGWNRDSDE